VTRPYLRPHPLGLHLWPLLLFLGGCGTLSKAPVYRPTDRAAQTAAPIVKSDLSGTWVLDRKASDDPAETLRAIRQRGEPLFGMADRGSDTGTLPSNGPGSAPGRQVRHHLDARRLTIVHRDPLLIITPGNGSPRRLYTDDRPASVTALGGEDQRVAIAGWEGDSLVVETTMGTDRVVEYYRLLSTPRRLEVVTELPDWGRPQGPAQIRRIYVPAAARH
jgi:hypothetical protein